MERLLLATANYSCLNSTRIVSANLGGFTLDLSSTEDLAATLQAEITSLLCSNYCGCDRSEVLVLVSTQTSALLSVR
jgi:hypothetical protein